MKSLEEIIKEMAAKGLLSNLDNAVALAKIKKMWKELVGEEAAKSTRPLSLQKGRLTIGTSSAVWNHQLSLMKGDLLEELAQKVEGVTELRFRVESASVFRQTDGER